MHVDGFRFDLASTLARELYDVDQLGAFFDIIHQDPVLSQVKLIAEPWDVGEGGYQVGNFPVLWTEWNGKYRDCVRRFWKGDGGTAREFATRLTGSSDLYEGERPQALRQHQLHHLPRRLHAARPGQLQRQAQRGQRRGEPRRRRTTTISWNCGVEGPTDDPAIIALRERQKRNLLATLLLSQGVPMLLGGDELGHTQQGNNNAYCQDNELTWLDWEHGERELLRVHARLIQLRSQDHPVFRRRRLFQGRPIRGTGVSDIGWFKPDGEEMSDEDWESGFAKSLGVFLNGEGDPGGRTSAASRCATTASTCLQRAPRADGVRFAAAAPRRALAGGARYRADLPRGGRDPRRWFVPSRDRAVARAPAPRRLRERCATSYSRRTTTAPWRATDGWTRRPSPRWTALRATGRKLILVTGRELDDLLADLPARRAVRPGGGRERRRAVRPAAPVDRAARRAAARAVRRGAATPGA